MGRQISAFAIASCVSVLCICCHDRRCSAVPDSLYLCTLLSTGACGRPYRGWTGWLNERTLRGALRPVYLRATLLPFIASRARGSSHASGADRCHRDWDLLQPFRARANEEPCDRSTRSRPGHRVHRWARRRWVIRCYSLSLLRTF